MWFKKTSILRKQSSYNKHKSVNRVLVVIDGDFFNDVSVDVMEYCDLHICGDQGNRETLMYTQHFMVMWPGLEGFQ